MKNKYLKLLSLFLCFPLFLESQNITEIEYFINTDPGIGEGTSISNFVADEDVSLTANIDISSIDNGVHYLYIRAKDNEDNWGLTQYKTFVKGIIDIGLPDIVYMEYFFDDDPGLEEGTSINITAAIDINLPTYTIDIPSNLLVGVHSFNIRAKNSYGNWSHIKTHNFVYGITEGGASSDIVYMEYFIDNDPGLEMAMEIPVNPNNQIGSNYTIILPDDINTGVHTLSIRAKNSYGNWSHIKTHNFLQGITEGGMSPDIVYMEYFIDNDPGLEMATTIPINANTTVGLNYTINLPDNLSTGMHTLSLRAKNDYGRWSHVKTHNFLKLLGTTPANIDYVEVKVEGLEEYEDWTPLTNFMPAPIVCPSFIVGEICNLPDGTYNVYARAKDDNDVWSIIAEESFTIQDIYTIQGTVVDINGNPLAVVALDFNELGTIYTNNSGDFSIDVPKCWEGEVSIVKDNLLFSPANLTFTGVVSNDDITITGYEELIASLQAKIYLEGAYNGGAMNTFLTTEIPLEQPYNIAPYNYMGTESLTTVSDNMVDWILVEMRSGTPSLFERNTVVVETRTAILLDNGTLVETDGTTPIRFYNLVVGEAYHVCIRHRNHLDILSANPISANLTMIYDFTASPTQAFGNFQQLATEDNKAAMFVGDYNQDGVIQISDFDAWKANPAQIGAYSPLDGTLDGVVQQTDNDAWRPNKAKIGSVEISF